MVKICAYRQTSPDQTVGAVFLDGAKLTAKVLPGWERGMTFVFNDPASFMVNGKRTVVAREDDPVRWFEMQPTVVDGSRFYATMVRPGKEEELGISTLVELPPDGTEIFLGESRTFPRPTKDPRDWEGPRKFTIFATFKGPKKPIPPKQ
jgi:hypothetical protein